MDKGTLKTGEPHPACNPALNYIQSIGFDKLMMYLESFSSCAIEGNRLAEICSVTLNRLINKEKVSDRYLLGLAWTIKSMEEEKN